MSLSSKTEYRGLILNNLKHDLRIFPRRGIKKTQLHEVIQIAFNLIFIWEHK